MVFGFGESGLPFCMSVVLGGGQCALDACSFAFGSELE